MNTMRIGHSVATPLTGPWRLYGHLERFWECAGLTALWLAGCVPILTAGSSTLALLRVVSERRDHVYRPVARAFWAEFVREPLPRAAITIIALLGGLGGLAVLFTGLVSTDILRATALQAAALIGAVMALGLSTTMMALVARGKRTSLRTLRLATAIAVCRPQTALAGAALTVATAVGIALAPPLVLVLGWIWARLLIDLSRSADRVLAVWDDDER